MKYEELFDRLYLGVNLVADKWRQKYPILPTTQDGMHIKLSKYLDVCSMLDKVKKEFSGDLKNEIDITGFENVEKKLNSALEELKSNEGIGAQFCVESFFEKPLREEMAITKLMIEHENKASFRT